ncbi:MAG: hypothetical protein ACE5GT_05990 [Rhodospirillales bacterium]
MRYSTLYVDSVRRWAVVDGFSGATGLRLFETEAEARAAAAIEERRWSKAVADALPDTA